MIISGHLHPTSFQAYGSPVALPMTCNTPLDFGQVPIGDTKILTVTCKTNIAITKLNGFTTNKPVFQVSNSSLPTGPLAVGATFSFPGMICQNGVSGYPC